MKNDQPLSDQKSLKELKKALTKHRKTVSQRIQQLAITENNSKKWKDYLERIFIPSPQVEIRFLEKEFTENTQAQTAYWLIQLLAGNTTKQDIGILHKIFHYPEKLISHSKNSVAMIGNVDITNLLQAFTKIAVLEYLIESYDAIQMSIVENSLASNQRRTLQKLTLSWLTHQTEQIVKIQTDMTTWESFWRFHLRTSVIQRFGIGRLFSLRSDNIINPFSQGGMVNRVKFKLLFWLHIPLIVSLLQNLYINSTQKSTKQIYNYIRGKKSVFSVLKITFNVTFLALKILFSPLILLGPLVLGLTSLPLTLLRNSIQLLFNTPSLFKDYLLGVCDYVETIKDLLLVGAMLYFAGSLIANFWVLPPALAVIANYLTHFTTICFISFFTPTSFTKTEMENVYFRHFNRINQPIFHLVSLVVTLTATASIALLIAGRLTMNLMNFLSEVRQFISQRVLKPVNNQEIHAASTLSYPEQNNLIISETFTPSWNATYLDAANKSRHVEGETYSGPNLRSMPQIASREAP